MSTATVLIVSGRPDPTDVLPAEHGLSGLTHATPADAVTVIHDLRSRRMPFAAVLDGASVHLAPLLNEFAIKYPEVPLVIATAGELPDAPAPLRGVRRPRGSAALVGAIRDAARSALQYARVRTTLDRLNIRLQTADPEADEKQRRRLLLSGLYFASLLEQATDAIFVTDRDGVVALWNGAAERLFGVAAGDIVGRRIDVLGEVCNGPGLLSLVRSVDQEEPARTAEFACVTAVGRRDAEVSLSLVTHEGSGIAVSGIVRDVTERNALYGELRQKTEALAASNRHKEEFLAVLSHELRTPLNTVLGWARMLSNMPHDPVQVRRAAEMIERNAAVQWRLVSDLLEYARIAAGQLRLERSLLNLAALARATVESVRPEVEQRGLQLREHHEDTVLVCADAERITQVLSNLLSNAAKFTPAGGEIHVSVRRRAGAAELQVRDTGRGIDPVFLPHVFEEFRQADASTTRMQQGLGLGLAITRRIVELHGGRITAESDGPDRGATFTVALALAAEAGDTAGG